MAVRFGSKTKKLSCTDKTGFSGLSSVNLVTANCHYLKGVGSWQYQRYFFKMVAVTLAVRFGILAVTKPISPPPKTKTYKPVWCQNYG